MSAATWILAGLLGMFAGIVAVVACELVDDRRRHRGDSEPWVWEPGNVEPPTHPNCRCTIDPVSDVLGINRVETKEEARVRVARYGGGDAP